MSEVEGAATVESAEDFYVRLCGPGLTWPVSHEIAVRDAAIRAQAVAETWRRAEEVACWAVPGALDVVDRMATVQAIHAAFEEAGLRG